MILSKAHEYILISFEIRRKSEFLERIKYFFRKQDFLSSLSIFLILFIFRQKGREGEGEREKHQCVVAPYTPPTGDLAHNPGTCSDWESNWRPFGSQAST